MITLLVYTASVSSHSVNFLGFSAEVGIEAHAAGGMGEVDAWEARDAGGRSMLDTSSLSSPDSSFSFSTLFFFSLSLSIKPYMHVYTFYNLYCRSFPF